ncbi:hypothetical protein [Flavobacterium psychrophilum]|uniref:hypothetical protein n=1 Tax=Flavobacterium psychrophilum TaxID=96345 RepID=UPI00106A1EEA|nr:hypothetical protein [Flavobacterium psychrophilum]MCB6095937.1 hypothetical protein [Flavobacterium psychrophilum]MCB6097706.1 hypothetical protein [Flavobacterium psychrophilum]MCB6127905.1 hypothetical protein [Flavobacterium psychrophilum]
MKSLCYSVRLSSLTEISDKCYKAIAFDGSEALIPKSQVFGQDYGVSKSEAYWISAWILEQKSIQYSRKKQATFDSDTRKEVPVWTVEKNEPIKIKPLENNTIKELKK